MALVKEFREFAVKGNAVDLAVGVIIGAAFGKIVTSLVDDVIMPPLGILVGKHDFSGYFLNLSSGNYGTIAEAKAAGAATLNYGLFLNAVVNFIIVGFAIFLVVRTVNRLRKPATETVVVAPTTRECPLCKSEIPIAASRCRFCTQAIEPVAPPTADKLPIRGGVQA